VIFGLDTFAGNTLASTLVGEYFDWVEVCKNESIWLSSVVEDNLYMTPITIDAEWTTVTVEDATLKECED
jgi:hypothetical protein